MRADIKARLTPSGSDFELNVVGDEVKVYIQEPGTSGFARYSRTANVNRVARAVEELGQALGVIEHAFGHETTAEAKPAPDFVALARKSLEVLEFHDQDDCQLAKDIRAALAQVEGRQS